MMCCCSFTVLSTGTLKQGLGFMGCCRSLDSEAGVGYWTDYLKAFLHPRSLFQLPGVWQGQGRFGAFGEGRGLFGAAETCDDVMDRVRYWVEECDTFQVTSTYCLCLFALACSFSLSVPV